MSDHAAKRQRLTGSFSPPSPQPAKTLHQTKPVAQPDTPTSPPYTSMNSHSNAASAQVAPAPTSEMTPPGSVHMSQHVSQSAAAASNVPPFPTPGSTAGAPTSSNIDSDGDAMMADGLEDDMDKTGEHRHSNHNRQSRESFSGTGAASGDTETVDGRLFKVGQSAHAMSRPHGSQNLFELYGLNDLAQSVARTNPVTGEKINKLRKSYEGHIKNLQIAGKPKAVKMTGAFRGPLSMPDQEYHLQRVNGKEFDTAMDPERYKLTSDFDALLDSAIAGMAPGSLPPAETQRYKAYIGTDEVVKSKVVSEAMPGRGGQTATPTQVNSAANSRISRPERSGAKRSYTDMSFQGYGDGYDDSAGGEDDGQGGIGKKRKLGFERTPHSVEVGGARR